MYKILLTVFFALLLSSCSFVNPCGEYGECVRDIEDAREYANTIENVESILLVSCIQGLMSTNHDGIPIYELVEDQSGICLILIKTITEEYKLYSYGKSVNTKELDVVVWHSVEEIHDLFIEHGIAFENTWLSMEPEYSDNIFLSVDELYFTFLDEELRVCEYQNPELCINYLDYFNSLE